MMGSTVPLWLQLSYTLFVVVLVPVYWVKYKPANFLWFSDIALFAIGISLWTESRMLVSMIAVGVLGLEIIWNIDYFGRLIRQKPLLGLSDYMFDSSKSLFLRGLSLFHVFLPALVIWLLLEWGYNPKAIYWQTLLTWVVLPIVYLFTDPKENINWVFGPGNNPQTRIPESLYFWIVMLFFPLFVFLPSHLLLTWLFQ
ncbi:membrane-associated protein [Pontibacter sp. MBLB2868]|uniref:membrane-associated protein n=1 Tax=Pontibacter sp. MBLB2868 TaxID=3451555 RepID=UPI003F74C72E